MSLQYDLDPEARCWKSKYERDDESFDELAADDKRHEEEDEEKQEDDNQ